MYQHQLNQILLWCWEAQFHDNSNETSRCNACYFIRINWFFFSASWIWFQLLSTYLSDVLNFQTLFFSIVTIVQACYIIIVIWCKVNTKAWDKSLFFALSIFHCSCFEYFRNSKFRLNRSLLFTIVVFQIRPRHLICILEFLCFFGLSSVCLIFVGLLPIAWFFLLVFNVFFPKVKTSKVFLVFFAWNLPSSPLFFS